MDAFFYQLTRVRLGGPEKFVMIDETIQRQKYHVGQPGAMPPVLVILEVEHYTTTETRQGQLVTIHRYRGVRMFACRVPKKSHVSMIPIITRIVLPGTSIITDGLATYQILQDLHGLGFGYQHGWVNHSQNFVNPDDRSIHTQTVESLNKLLRKSLGTYTNNFQMDLDLYTFCFQYNNWRREEPEKPMTPHEKMASLGQWARAKYPGAGLEGFNTPHWVHYIDKPATPFPSGDVLNGINICGRIDVYKRFVPHARRQQIDAMEMPVDSDPEDFDDADELPNAPVVPVVHAPIVDPSDEEDSEDEPVTSVRRKRPMLIESDSD